ncbi:MAG TPA: AAA family ATPase, partial [Candidatus Polarisedimenticolia bacterium]|nr:AAA family ATPase [Candidatus Polarisedimenticolia bacterium]
MTRLLKLDSMEIIGFKSFYGRTLFEFPEGITAVVGPNGCGKSNIGDAISWVLGEQKASSLRSDRMEDVIFNGSEGRRPLGMAEVSLHFKNLEANGNGHAADHEGNGHGGAGLEDPGQESLSPPARQSSEDANPIDGDLEVPIGLAQEVACPAEDAVLPGARFVLEEIPEDVVVTRRLYRSGESEYVLNGQRCRLMDIQHLLAKTQIGTRLYTTIEQGRIDQILTSKPKERRAILEEAAGILGYKVRRRQAEQKL